MSNVSRRELFKGITVFTLAVGVAGGSLIAVSNSIAPQGSGVGGQLMAIAPSDGWILTDDERALLAALDARSSDYVNEAVFEVSKDTDYYGGDLAAFRAKSLGDCAAACETDPTCSQYTYARVDHEVKAKRKMCWLKTPDVKETRTSAGYWSGRKKALSKPPIG